MRHDEKMTEVVEKMFNFHCSVCKTPMYGPQRMKGFDDRIRFSCLESEEHPPQIKFLTGDVLFKWRRLLRLSRRFQLRKQIFEKIIHCLLDKAAFSSVLILSKECSSCPYSMKRMCDELQNFQDELCFKNLNLQ